jgi:hypothetical protein
MDDDEELAKFAALSEYEGTLGLVAADRTGSTPQSIIDRRLPAVPRKPPLRINSITQKKIEFR